MPQFRRAIVLFALIALLRLGAMTGRLPAEEPPANAAAPFPRVPPTAPADAEATFRVLGGFRMELLAAEPLVAGPVAMEYDENGLAYVVQMVDYPYTDKSTDQPFVERTTDLPLGCIRVLEDTDGDGRFDRSDLFAEELSWPTGLAFWKGGVFVAATPDVWYLKDTDGDRKADVRRKVFTGFRKFNVQAVMNNLKWGLDHRIYGAGGSNGGDIRHADRPDAAPAPLARHDFRFDPRTEAFELISGGARFGNAFDDWGNRFICNIRNPAQHVVLPEEYLARNPFLAVASPLHDAALAGDTLPVFRVSPVEAWRAFRARRWAREANQSYPRSETAAHGYFTSSSGVTVYRGNAYPPEYRGNLFVAEVAGNLIHRQLLEPDGVTFVARRADPEAEFVASTDNWFRPVNFVNAPDGTLHVLDMYRETIEHPWSIPDDIKAQLDLESGRDRGRIYRLSPPGFQPSPPPRLGGAATAELVAQLEAPNSWWRETAHRMLFERQDLAAVPLLRTMAAASASPLARLHALWSLSGLNALGDDDLLHALADESLGVREHAVRLAERRTADAAGPGRLLERICELAGDGDVRVRFQVAFTLGGFSGPDVTAALARIARRDAADPWVRTAVLSSAGSIGGNLLAELFADADFAARPQSLPLFQELAEMIGSRGQLAETRRVVAAAANAAETARLARNQVILGLAEGLKRSGKPLGEIVEANSPGAALIASLLDQAAADAADDAAALDVRRQSVQLLSFGGFDRAQGVLQALLDPRQPREVQLAAVRALSSFANPEVAALLLASYAQLTPAVRAEVVEALLARSERLPALLDAVEARSVSIAQIPPARRKLLMQHADTAIRQRAVALFATDAPGPRSEVLAAYQESLRRAGDSRRGRMIFQRECLACHRLGDQGHDVGPNLATIRHRTPEEVLAHVLDPNREVSPDFLEYVVALEDGRILTGVIAAETAASLTLRRAEGVQETVLRNRIAEISGTGRSLMPEGMEKKISIQEMSDLLAFLLNSP